MITRTPCTHKQTNEQKKLTENILNEGKVFLLFCVPSFLQMVSSFFAVVGVRVLCDFGCDFSAVCFNC